MKIGVKLYEMSMKCWYLLLVCYDYLDDFKFLWLIFVIFAVDVEIMCVICRKNMSCYSVLNICNRNFKIFKKFQKNFSKKNFPKKFSQKNFKLLV